MSKNIHCLHVTAVIFSAGRDRYASAHGVHTSIVENLTEDAARNAAKKFNGMNTTDMRYFTMVIDTGRPFPDDICT